jgi:hypothetical protein
MLSAVLYHRRTAHHMSVVHDSLDDGGDSTDIMLHCSSSSSSYMQSPLQ